MTNTGLGGRQLLARPGARVLAADVNEAGVEELAASADDGLSISGVRLT